MTSLENNWLRSGLSANLFDLEKKFQLSSLTAPNLESSLIKPSSQGKRNLACTFIAPKSLENKRLLSNASLEPHSTNSSLVSKDLSRSPLARSALSITNPLLKSSSSFENDNYILKLASSATTQESLKSSVKDEENLPKSELPYEKPSPCWTPAEVQIVPRVEDTSLLPKTITSKDVKLLESTDLFAEDSELENEKNELLEIEENERKGKIALLHEVNLCLVNRIDFKKLENPNVKSFQNLIESVIAGKRPEFALQVALYARRFLNIRTASNFIVAVAASHPESRQFVRAYFSAMVVTPSDWVEIAEINEKINSGTISTSLRKAMTEKFREFDEYQLQKHNKRPQRKKKLPGDIVVEEETPARVHTIKNLIRTLHIKDPAEFVMAILGKPYPSSYEEYARTRLTEPYDRERAGQRMKLKTALTWETELTAKGNIAEAWEGLIKLRKLPYMAGLRNIRNIFYCGINEECDGLFRKFLSNRNAVARSKQMPSQFFAAYEIIQSLENEVNDIEDANTNDERSWQTVLVPYGRGVKRILDIGWSNKSVDVPTGVNDEESFKQFLTKLAKEKNKPKTSSAFVDKENWKKLLAFCKAEHYRAKNPAQRGTAKKSKIHSLRAELVVGSETWKKTLLRTIKRYKTCVNQAILYAINNVPSVPGRSVFFIKKVPFSAGKGKQRTGLTADKNFQALVMAACAIKSCQDAEFYFYEDCDENKGVATRRLHFDKKASSLIDMVQKWKDADAGDSGIARYQDTPAMIDWILFEQQPLSVNRIVFVNERDLPEEYLKTRQDFVENRLRVYSLGERQKLDKIVSVSGCNEQVLRFIAEDSKADVIKDIEAYPAQFNIHLDDFANKANAPGDGKKEKRVLKVFISSTYADLAVERQRLVDSIIPAFNKTRDDVVLVPIDIRFPENFANPIRATTYCLKKIMEADIVVGILGERYGSVPGRLYEEIFPPAGFDFTSSWSEDNRKLSITAAELLTAHYFKKPMIIFKKQMLERDPRVESLSQKLDVSVYNFQFISDLSNLVTESLVDLVDESLTNANGPIKEDDLAFYGRHMVLNSAKNCVFEGQSTVIFGKKDAGKTCLLKYLRRKEIEKERLTAWFDCSKISTVEDILDGIREQLGVVVKPKEDSKLLESSLPLNATVFIDNAQHLETIDWAILSHMARSSVVFSVRTNNFALPRMFKETARNFLHLKPLSSSEKKVIFNGFLGFEADRNVHRAIDILEGSSNVAFLKMLAAGLRTFTNKIPIQHLPKTFDELGPFILKISEPVYGYFAYAAAGMLLDKPVDYEVWLHSLFLWSGASAADESTILLYASGLEDWLVDVKADKVELKKSIRAGVSSLEMLLDFKDGVLQSYIDILRKNKETSTRTALENLPSLLSITECSEFIDAKIILLLRKLDLLKSVTKEILKFGDKRLTSRMEKISYLNERYSADVGMRQALVDCNFKDKDLSGESFTTKVYEHLDFNESFGFLSSQGGQIISSEDNCVSVLCNEGQLITRDFSKGDTLVKHFTFRGTHKIVRSRSNAIVVSNNSISICCPDFTVEAVAKNSSGAVTDVVVALSGKAFVTLHADTRCVNFWRAEDAKLIWSQFFDHVPGKAALSDGVGSVSSEPGFDFQRVAVGLWNSRVNLYNAIDGTCVAKIDTDVMTSITALSFDQRQDELLLAVGYSSGELRWMSAKCGTLTAKAVGAPEPVTSFLTSDTCLASTTDSSIAVWEKVPAAEIVKKKLDLVFGIFKSIFGYVVVHYNGNLTYYKCHVLDSETPLTSCVKIGTHDVRVKEVLALDSKAHIHCLLVRTISNEVYFLFEKNSFAGAIRAPLNMQVADNQRVFLAESRSGNIQVVISDNTSIVVETLDDFGFDFLFTGSDEKQVKTLRTLRTRRELTHGFRLISINQVAAAKYLQVASTFVTTSVMQTTFPFHKKEQTDKKFSFYSNGDITDACVSENKPNGICAAVTFENCTVSLLKDSSEGFQVVVNFALLQVPTEISLFGNVLVTTSTTSAQIFSKRGKVLASTGCRGFQNGASVVSVKEKKFDWEDDEPAPSEFVDIEDVLLIGKDGHSIQRWRPSSMPKVKSVHVEELLTAQKSDSGILFSSSEGIFEMDTDATQQRRARSQIKLVDEFEGVVYMATDDEVIAVENGEWKRIALKSLPFMLFDGLLVYFEKLDQWGVVIKALDILRRQNVSFDFYAPTGYVATSSEFYRILRNSNGIEALESSRISNGQQQFQKNIKLYKKPSNKSAGFGGSVGAKHVEHYTMMFERKKCGKIEMSVLQIQPKTVCTGLEKDSLEPLELPFMVRKVGIFKNGANSFLVANAYRFGVCIYTYSAAEGKQLLGELVVQEKISAITINVEGNLVIAFQNGTFSRAVPL